MTTNVPSKTSLQFRLSNLSIRGKMVMVILITLAGLLYFAEQNIVREYRIAEQSKSFIELVDISSAMSNLVHELQKERGMSAGFLKSGGTSFATQLIEQRRNADAALAVLQKYNTSRFGNEFNTLVAGIYSHLEALPAMRQSISALSVPAGDAVAYYTDANTKLLNSFAFSATLAPSVTVSNDIVAVANLLLAKERAGIERAVGAGGFASGFAPAAIAKFNRLIIMQDSFLYVFNEFANSDQLKLLTNAQSGEAWKAVDQLRNIALSADTSRVSSEQWFATITQKINLYRDVELNLVAGLKNKAHNLQAAAQTDFWLAIILSALCILLTLVIFMLVVRNIAQRINVVRDNIDALLNNIETKPVYINDGDELGDMARTLEELKIQALDNAGKLNAIDTAQASIEFDMDGTIRNANQNFLDAVGYPLAEIKGKHHSIFVRESERKSAEYLNLWKQLNNGQPQTGEFKRVTKAGKEIWINAIYAPIVDGKNKPVKVIKYATEITDAVVMRQDNERGMTECISVLKQVSDGNLTTRMNDAYNGAFNDIKDALNRTLDKLVEVFSSINDSASSVNTAAREIAVGSNDLALRTEQQASNLEETAASMQQLTATVRENTHNANNAKELSVDANNVANSGGTVVTEAVAAMGAISKSSEKIANIIGVIDEIAFQTNLLALNAAVEAARAGDAGKGFAVVASEVRSLAGRSATASKEIKQLINESVTQVESGAELVNKTGDNLQKIVGSVKQVSQIVAEIATASNQQSNGIGEVNSAVGQMDEMTQQNAALVEENSAAAQSLQEQAAHLESLVAYFDLGNLSRNATSKPTAHAVAAPKQHAINGSNGANSVPAVVANNANNSKASLEDDGWEEF